MLHEFTSCSTRSTRSVVIRIVALVTMCACVFVGSGCSLLMNLFTPSYARRTVKFSEMEYSRPDYDAFETEIKELTASVESNDISYSKQLDGLYSINEQYWNFYTMYTLADLRYCLDTSDEFYYGECSFFAEKDALVAQLIDDLYVACGKSVHKKDFEGDYFSDGFLDDYADGGTYSDELVALLQDEAAIILDYKELTANPVVQYDNKEQYLYELLENTADIDEYYAVICVYLEQINPQIGGLYVELVKIRMQIAEMLGYDSYMDYAFTNLGRDYAPQEAIDFVDDVRNILVPLYNQLLEENKIFMLEEPEMSNTQLVSVLGDTVSGMSELMEEAYDFMIEYELFDIAPSANKANDTFTTYLENYDAPFIMMSAIGGTSDLIDFSHEFGHFTDNYLNYNMNYSLDQSECASQAVEYLMLCNLQGCSQAQEDFLLNSKMYDTLMLYLGQAQYSLFEQLVFELDYEQVTLNKINEIAAYCAEQFPIDNGVYSFGLSWTDIPHFFEQSFYVISYCVSNDIALQIYQQERASAGAGVATYEEFIDWDLDMSLQENAARVGLVSPFDDGRIDAIAAMLRGYYYDN